MEWMGGERHKRLVCAGAPASMALANKHPERELAPLDSLKASLDEVQADRFVLRSTVAVQRWPDAGHTEAGADYERDLAYGRNRRVLEAYRQACFASCLITGFRPFRCSLRRGMPPCAATWPLAGYGDNIGGMRCSACTSSTGALSTLVLHGSRSRPP